MKQGYKKISLGIIPNEWEVVKLGDVFDFLKTFTNSRTDLNFDDEISYIHYGEIHTKYKHFIDFSISNLPKISLKKLKGNVEFIKNGDLVVVDASEDYKDIAKSVEIKNLTTKAVAGLHTFLLRDKNKNFANGYKGYILYCQVVKKEINRLATGISVLGISKNNLSNIKIPLPPLKEQTKIAEILSEFDTAINLTSNLISQKTKFKKALMQNLLTAKIRFPNFKDKWQEVKLGNFIQEKSQKNSDNINLVLSVTNKFGFVEQSNYFDKKVASKDTSNYKIIKKGNFAYNPSRINVGSIALLEKFEVGILSPMYIVFKCLSGIDKNFLNYWLQSHNFTGNLYKYLAGSVRETLNFKDMKNFKIKLPNLDEQKKIAEILSRVDDEIEILNKKLENLKELKKGVMQNLLTGKVRVK
ncbi:type I restriction-modification system subunit S [Campylobacter sputorum subsp. bubulus]|uniref:Type I restriction-modification system subunit S n=1 Tax=Campylobacter sputorum subsp. sputorum TaxID=32024 RepID=A0A381DJL9_9BACT|nr:restriction endonuclease subunit S [Campylobacter sputorum]ASM35834.1 type I restriction/modification system, S subunit [Campylobacter sputorum aubsp. sputorum RM3237]KAB0581547.1 restriction endonuclease subunit S [Campylobacter sputorum subsp. sputorum]QEL06024.1 type I restriction/modification system, specificity subunit [Campylobacter sputorum subsp. sputorum]SUX09134.1 type I restriction-modification system subunit S [Campylobacter sputorum subsp. bubulus]SUX10825.1 type I restriction-